MDKKTSKPIKVLIVEDDRSNRFLSMLTLRKLFGPEVVFLETAKAESAEELLDTCDDISLVVLDFILLGKDGDYLVPIIRRTQKSCIVAAASDNEKSIDQLMEAGCDIKIGKNLVGEPTDPELVDSLKKVVLERVGTSK